MPLSGGASHDRLWRPTDTPMLEVYDPNPLAQPRVDNRDIDSIVMEIMTGFRIGNAWIAHSGSGTGEPTLLFHHFPASSVEWENLRDTLDQYCRVVTPKKWMFGVE